MAITCKSEKDKLDRLPDQMKAMRAVANQAFAVIHEKFLVEKKTNKHAGQFQRDGEWYLEQAPKGIGLGPREAWVYPRKDRGGYDRLGKWSVEDRRPCTSLPPDAIKMLWRDELYELCGRLSVPVHRRAVMQDMIDALRWQCCGADLTRGICATLRARQCLEADPAIEQAA